MKLITQEEKEIILKLRESGWNAEKIGKEINRGHQFVVNCLKREGKYLKKETVCKRKYHVNENFFDKIDTESKAYILGFICADGHICNKTNRIKITVATKDEDILETIKNSMNSNHPIKRGIYNNPYKKSNNKICYKSSLCLNSKTLVKSLSFIPKVKTYNLSSSVLEFVEENVIRHFLRGYFDGDGSVFFGIKYSSGTKYLIQIAGNKEFLENTFQKYYHTDNKLYYYKASKQCYCWKLSSKKNVCDFLQFLYEDSTIYLKRKFEIYKSAHVKPIELLETQTNETRAISSEASIEERSETIETTC